MRIRPYSEEDLSAVLSIYALSKLDEMRFEQEQFEFLPLNQDEKRWTKFLESEKYVFENHEQKILAYAVHYHSELRHLFVLPTERGKGIGKSLLEFLIPKLNTPINLFISKSNHPARALYASFGFKTIREFESDYNGQSVMVNEMQL